MEAIWTIEAKETFLINIAEKPGQRLKTRRSRKNKELERDR